MIRIESVTYRVAGRVLLDNASAALPPRGRVGLVGRNGVGKTTLLRLIAGDMEADAGTIGGPATMRLGRLAQEAPDGPSSLLQVVLDADTERAALLAEAETAQDPDRIAEIHDRLLAIDAHSAEARAATILAGLGFDHAAQQEAVGSLSGGWRMRVALAAALFAAPDLLLLDEPTNHLDLEATIWLQNFLESWPHALLLVSHDREVLNQVCQYTLLLEHQQLELFNGNYDRFERTRRERLEQQERQRVRMQAERARMQVFIDRFRAKATKARQAQSRIKALAKMDPPAAVLESAPTTLDFPQPEPMPPPIITLDGAAAGYGPDAASNPVLRNLSLRLDMDDRIALLGPNGNGKSTLAKLLAGRLEPARGSIHRAPKLRVGFFAQHQADDLVATESGFDHMRRALPEAGEAAVRGQLGRFGFSGDRADTPTGSLSGGEKARLLLALMTRNKPHLLILDEPTNHLDIDTRAALVQALNVFEGAIVLITHDPNLVELVADRLWLVADGGCQSFDGDMDAYRRFLRDHSEPTRAPRQNGRDDAAAPADTAGGASARERRQSNAELRKQLAPLRKAARTAEDMLERLTARRDAVQDRMADPAFYTKPGPEQAAAQKQLGELQQEIEAAELAWLEAQEALESAQAAVA